MPGHATVLVRASDWSESRASLCCQYTIPGLLRKRWGLEGCLNSWVAYGYLAPIGSVGILSLALYVLSRWTASASSYVFLLIPVFTVVFAALLLGERITISFVIGAALVIAGVWLGAIRQQSEPPDTTCPEVPAEAMC